MQECVRVGECRSGLELLLLRLWDALDQDKYAGFSVRYGIVTRVGYNRPR